jgi:hypothetical protein
MSTQRIYSPAMCFGLRIVGLRNLWDPTTEYQGKKQDKPTYLTGFITPKTRANWFEEPVLNDVTRALQELYNKALSHIPFPQVVWPIKDGDTPEPGKTPADWMRGHWYLPGSSTSPINTEIAQNGQTVKITNRAIVKPGDFAAVSFSYAVKTNDARAVKAYCNSVLFMNPGEEIAVGNSVTGKELMEKGLAQGLQITGFSAGGGGGFGGGGFGGGQPQQGFNQGGFQAQQGGQPGGFPGNGGFAQTQGGPAQTGFAGNPNNGAGNGSAFPSNQPQGQQQYNAPAPAQPQNNGFGSYGTGGQANPTNNGFGGGGNFTPPNGGNFTPPNGGNFPGQGQGFPGQQ